MVEQHVGAGEVGLGQGIARRRKPVGAFPPEHRTEHRAELLHPVVTRRAPQRPRRLAFLIGVVHGEDLGVGFLVLRNQVAAPGVIAEAARIDPHHVDGRFTIDNPVRQLPPRAAGRSDPEAVAFIEPEIAQPPRRADDRRPVGRIGDGPVIDLLDANLAKRRHALHRCQNVGLKPFQRVGEQFVFALGCGTIDIAGRRADFVRAEQQPAGFLAHVVAGVGFAQHPHLWQPQTFAFHDRGMLFGDDVLMFDRDHRDIEANHRPGLPGKVARAGNHMFASDFTLIGRNQPFARGQLGDAGYRGVAINRCPAQPRAFGQRLSQISGLDIAVVGMLDCTDDASGVAQRPDVLDLIGGQEIDVHPDRLGDSSVIMIFVEAVLAGGQTDVRNSRKADIQSGFRLEAGVQTDRILVQLAHRIAEIEQWQQAGGVPRRARGQLFAFEQD